MSTIALQNPYCELRDAQAVAGNTDEESARDLVREINNASRFIEEYCRRDFLFHDHANTPLLVREGWIAQNVIYLPWPVITLTEVRVDGVALPASEWRHQPGTTASNVLRNGPWLPADGIVQLDPFTPRPALAMPPRIELVGTFGYAPAEDDAEKKPSPSLPATIRQACATIAAINSGLVRRDFTNLGGDRESVTVRTFPKETYAALNRYKVAVV